MAVEGEVMKKRELLERIEQLERQVAQLNGMFTNSVVIKSTRRELEEEQTRPGKAWPQWVTGQPSMTVTATDEKDADLAKAATQALRFVEGDMAGKLREFLGPMAPDYMRQIDVPLPTFRQEASQVPATVEAPPKPAYEAEVERREKEACRDVAGVHEAPAPRAPILLYPHSLEGFHVGTGTAHQIDKLARAGSLESDAALMDFLRYVVEKVMWYGRLGKIDGLEGVFKYEMDGDVFKVDYQGVDLGSYSLMDGWWLKRIV